MNEIALVEKFCLQLKELRFEEAEATITILNTENYKVEGIAIMASDVEDGVGILVYTFFNWLISKEEKADWHKAARDSLSTHMCHYKFAYEAAFHHAKKVVEIGPFTTNDLHRLIYIGHICVNILTDIEVRNIAQKILEIDSTDKEAIAYVNLFNKNI